MTDQCARLGGACWLWWDECVCPYIVLITEPLLYKIIEQGKKDSEKDRQTERKADRQRSSIKAMYNEMNESSDRLLHSVKPPMLYCCQSTAN